MMIMPLIPVTLEVEVRRIAFQGQPGQKVTKTLSQSISQAWWYISVIPPVWKA
jgi:hypothetical protein